MELPRWLELMGRDKKVDRGQVRLVLLRAIGHAIVTADFDPDGPRGGAARSVGLTGWSDPADRTALAVPERTK